MGDFGNAIKYLYSQFILRDVLSSITPGAVVALTAFLILLPEPTLKHSLEKIFIYSRDMHWLLYIPLFGVFYIAGFAIECLGRISGFIRIHPFDKSNFWERLMVFCPRCDKHNKIWEGWKKHQGEELDVEKAIQEEKSWSQPTRERLIVIKQMCSNGAIAIIIAGVFLIIKLLLLKLQVSSEVTFIASMVVVGIVALLLLASLFWGYRWAKYALDTAERKINPYESGNQENNNES